MNFINKLERKLGRFAIHNLMRYVVVCYVIGYILRFVSAYSNVNILNYLTLEPYMIFHYGQVWRFVSWLLVPPSNNVIFAIIMIILYYQLGNVLEQSWGAFRFNLYIFGGVIFSIIGSLILYGVYSLMGIEAMVSIGSGFSTHYINLAIFLAFALCYPDMQILLYFIIPIKMKWMAIVYAAIAVYGAIQTNWGGRVALIMSLLNFIIFFLLTRNLKRVSPKEVKRKQVYRQTTRQPQNATKHKCAICGRTEADNPDLVFRYCTKCNGNYEYCQEHLFSHKHVQ